MQKLQEKLLYLIQKLFKFPDKNYFSLKSYNADITPLKEDKSITSARLNPGPEF
jgi:hypothetical protein